MKTGAMSSQLVSVLIMIVVNNSLVEPHHIQDGLEGFRAKRSFTTFSITRPFSKFALIMILR